MTQMKRRLSILLCFLLVFTTVFVAAPTETQAATTYNLSGIGTNNNKIYVYNGADNLYAGDFIYAYSYGETYENLGQLSLLKNVTYTSDNKKVATVNKSTGKITTKKVGTTKITVKYKGIQATFNLVVVSKTDFYKKLGDYYKNIAATADKDAKAFLKITGDNPTIKSSTRYKYLNAYKNYSGNSGTTSYGGEYNSETGTYEYSHYVYSPSANHAYAIYSKIGSYADDYNPFSTWSAKHFDVKSISGKAKSKTITLTLKQKVTDNQIYGANYAFSWDTEVEKSSTYSFPIVVQRVSTGRQYYAIATIKKGTKKMTIELRNHKLVKGETYKLLAKTSTGRYGSYLGNWLDDTEAKNTFKAK